MPFLASTGYTHLPSSISPCTHGDITPTRTQNKPGTDPHNPDASESSGPASTISSAIIARRRPKYSKQEPRSMRPQHSRGHVPSTLQCPLYCFWQRCDSLTIRLISVAVSYFVYSVANVACIGTLENKEPHRGAGAALRRSDSVCHQ